MNSQDFKALLDALNRIEKAIEGLKTNDAREVVNRFAVVFRMLKKTQNWNEGDRVDDFKELQNYILEIQKTYAKIAAEVMNENNQSSEQIKS
mgnify:CR=1 FL=1